jgi:hypothetical protein
MTTITASMTAGITLTTASYTNPIVVNEGVTIVGTFAGVFAGLAPWTIQNNGSIGGAAGVDLYMGGSVTNAVFGSIIGVFDGINIGGGGGAGTVINTAPSLGWAPAVSAFALLLVV